MCKKSAPFAVGVFSTWQVASQRNHYMREEKGGNEHTCGWAPEPRLRSPITVPPTPRGRCGKCKDKGRRERERKEEIVGEIYRPLQQLTEG